VKNQGTQSVKIYSTQEDTDGVPTVTMFDAKTGKLLTESSPSNPIEVGDELRAGLEIDTQDVDISSYNVHLTINAVATSD